MKKLIIILTTISIVGFNSSCKKENLNKEVTTNVGPTKNNSYSINNKPFRKFSKSVNDCIAVVLNCSPEDVIVKPHYDAAIITAIANNDLPRFFENTENCGVFLPNGTLGNDLKDGLTSGIYGVYRSEHNDKVFYFIGDKDGLSEDNFVFVTAAVIGED